MDPVYIRERLEGSDIHDVTSWVSVCSRGLWEVQRRRTHSRGQETPSDPGNDGSSSSDDYPRMGSLCRVRVRLKDDLNDTESSASVRGDEEPSIETDRPITEAQPTSFPRSPTSVLHVPLGDWTTLRLGEGQCDITEACVEGMRVKEKCEISLTPTGSGPGASVSRVAEGRRPLHATVELHSFTPGQESWEMPPVQKWDWVRSHKERGGARFRNGDVWGAADSYGRALKFLVTLRGHASEGEVKGEEEEEEEERRSSETQNLPTGSPFPPANEYNTIKAELHSNLSLCQLKLEQPARARASAAKATQLEPGGAKAWYRLGQACRALDELGEARQAFKTLLELQPDSPAAQRALREVASREKETNAQLGQRLSKMFS